MLKSIIIVFFSLAIISLTIFAEDSSINEDINNIPKRNGRGRDFEGMKESRREKYRRLTDHEDILDMEMEDHMERYKRSHDHRRDRHGRHSERTKRDIGAVRYSILEKRLNQNLDKFTDEEIATIRREMEEYLKKENSIGDFHESLQADRDMVRKIDNKEKRLAKLEEIKVKHKAMGQAHKEQRNIARDMFHAVREKIDAKLSTEL